MPIKLNSTGGGSITIDVPNMSTANTLTLPAITGNVITSADSNTITQPMISRSGFYGGFGPAFSAYLNTNQVPSNSTWTKIQLSVEEFDTASCFDSSTNYRFTPTVAGYYFISGCVSTQGSSSHSTSAAAIYKNGSLYKYTGLNVTFAATSANMTTVNSLVYLNGSTDFVELWGYLTGTGTINFQGGQTYLTYCSGYLARPA